MKIGILTLPLLTNYGGILQAYALQTILERMGHEVIVIDDKSRFILKVKQKPYVYAKRFIKKYILKENIRVFSEQYHRHTYSIIGQYTQSFISEYIHKLEISNLSILQKKNLDIIIVGSDQVWRPSYNAPIAKAYLNFAKSWKIKRIAYAASFGTDEWEYTPKQTKCCMKLLHQFSAISVREESGIRLCHEHFRSEAKHVLDPTFLLNCNDYIQLIKRANIHDSKGELFCYILDETENKDLLIEQVSKKLALTPFYTKNKKIFSESLITEKIVPPVEQWLLGFQKAKFVVTDSFHGCVFSILFNKPFIVYGNAERGMARFDSLLSLFELQDRFVSSFEEYKQKEFKAIDWSNVNQILDQKRKESIYFLESNL